MSDLTPLATTDELQDGDRKSVFIDDVPCLLFRVGNEYFAIEDVCTHDGQPLTDGPVSGKTITCPRHGARFDLATGKPLCMPAVQSVATYSVLIRGETIYGGTAEAIANATSFAKEPLPVISSEPNSWNTVRTAPPNPFAASPPQIEGADNATAPVASGEPIEIQDGTIIEALRQVIDPELMINIVDLGLVYTINYSSESRSAQIEMTLTSPACPAGPQIIQQSKMSLEKIPGIEKAEIKLVMTPPWTPARMTDEARDLLGIF